MCGITGVVSLSSTNREIGHDVKAMTDCVRHRGPDDGRVWSDHTHGIALGHRRLSIVDLSDKGAQPMELNDSGHVIVYNGEIYNYKSLRSRLFNHCSFRGHSDTEVVLRCVERYGPTRTLNLLNGMFAFCIWNPSNETIFLARDRIGIKPLYYGFVGNRFVFSSEVGAITKIKDFNNDINHYALCRYLRDSYISAPYSIYDDIYKLEPGSYITTSLQDLRDNRSIRPKSFWSLGERNTDKGLACSDSTRKKARRKLHDLIKDSVERRMIADVPVGTFLSGGIDSSLVTAVAQSISSTPIDTYSIGFLDDRYDESNYAREVANALGTNHHSKSIHPSEALDFIPSLASLHGEPFADYSMLPTYFVSKFARNGVKVSLSGDGGDELFGGYEKYQWTLRIQRMLQSMPLMVRKAMGGMSRVIDTSYMVGLYNILYGILPSSYRVRRPHDNVGKLIQVIGSPSSDIYSIVTRNWDPNNVLNIQMQQKCSNGRSNVTSGLHEMIRKDMDGYLPDGILAKVDRASMSVGLEVRVPLLDHRVVEYSWTLPSEYKINGHETKSILREILYQYLPPRMFDRPKMGFGIPLDEWLRGPLQDWAEELLSPRRLRSGPFFKEEVLRKIWSEHKSGKRNWQYRLWSILMFQAWYYNDV